MSSSLLFGEKRGWILDYFFASLRNLNRKAGADANKVIVDVAVAEGASTAPDEREIVAVAARGTGPIITIVLIS